MEREDNYSSEIGNIVESWVISNFVNDLTMLLNNTKMYDELIVVNEQILKIDWGNEEDTNLFHENAKRNIADAYADMNNIEKAYELYRGYLDKDHLWGWGWIGYYQILKSNDKQKFRDVIEEIYNEIKNGVRFRDMEDLCQELSDEFYNIDDMEKSDYLLEILKPDDETRFDGKIFSMF